MRRFRITPLRVAAGILLASLAFAGVGYAASVGLTSKSLHVWTQTLTKAACNQTSTTADDTYVQQASPTSTAGATATTLTIKPNAGAQDYAFIRFDLSGCSLPTTGGADDAVLTVEVTSKGNDTISVFPVTSSWSSSTLNWNGVSGLTIGSDRDRDVLGELDRREDRDGDGGRRHRDQGRNPVGLGAASDVRQRHGRARRLRERNRRKPAFYDPQR